MNAYAPRRQSKRWLDGDCPRGVLAIYYAPKEPADPYTIFYYPDLSDAKERQRGMWITYVGISEDGQGYHGELEAYKVAEYRYRVKHQAKKWSELPERVRDWIRKDLADE